MSDWYNSNSSWYAPLEAESTELRGTGKNESTERGSKKRKRSRIIGLVCLGAVVAAGILFSGFNKQSFSFSFTHNGATTEFSGGSGSFDIPGFSIVPGNNEDSEELPSTAQEFFDSYYTSVDTSKANVNIPKYSGRSEFTLELQEQPDREMTLQELYSQCVQSIVSIDTYQDEAEYGMGSGVVLSSDGLILTNTHVVDECTRAVVVMADNSEYEAELIGADAISDLAVLKIDGAELKPAAFGDSSLLMVGDKVAAIGNPLDSSLRLTLTDGIISAIERGIAYNGRSMTLLQTNTALNSGNSGGALFNMYGQVIGITNMKMSTSAFSSAASIEGIGFAIPSTTAKTVVEALLEYGEVRGRPSIGITVGAIPAEAKESYNLPDGLYISAVSEGSDAEKKGIVPGDVLIAVNGQNITTADEVNEIKNALQVGDTMTLSIWRNGVIRDYVIELKDTNEIY